MAKVIIKYAPKSLDDLDQIETYYSDYPSSKQISLIFEYIDRLKEQPFRGRPIPELQDENIRQINVGNYRVIYHVIADDLLMILRIFHFKRNFSPDSDLDFNY